MIQLTADTHFGHEKVAKARGFPSVIAHDAAILNALIRNADGNTETIIAGDFALGGWRDALQFIHLIPGTKHLVLGNHDRAHPMASNGHRFLREYLAVFDSVSTSIRLRHNGRDVLISHFPYDGDHVEGGDRGSQWRLRDEGSLLLHGHTHSNQRVSASQSGTPQIHIGLDAWGLRPVTLGQALAELS